jgi:hypothetical protein
MGDKKAAIHFYALALNARNPEPETRGRMAALVGDDGKLDDIAAKYRDELVQERTLKLSNPLRQSGSADFFVMLTAGPNADATLEDIKFASGDDKLKSFQEKLRTSKFPQSAPDKSPTRILRRGTLSCPSPGGDCTLVLALPEDVRSIQ